MLIRVVSVSGLMLLTGILVGRTLDAADTETWDGTIVQYGTMHEAIGEQQHQGRVQLNTLVERPHFFAVGALDKLEGEITILDNNVTVTRVDAARQLESGKGSALENQATLLIGAYVPSWAEHKVAENVHGQRTSKFFPSQDFGEKVFVPAGDLHLASDAFFPRVMFQSRDGEAP